MSDDTGPRSDPADRDPTVRLAVIKDQVNRLTHRIQGDVSQLQGLTHDLLDKLEEEEARNHGR